MTYDLQFDRLIEADPEVVFDLFTRHEGQLAFYQGPEPTWIVRSRCELRVGGEWYVAFGPSEDQLYQHRHVFKAIERPYRIRMTTTETRLDGSSFETEMEFLFEDVGGGRTRLTLHHRGFPTTDLRDEHSRGLPKAFGAFGRVLGGRGDPDVS